MKKYSVFSSSQGDFVTVKQGWSWPAFFFVFFWAIAKKLWFVCISYFVIILVSYISIRYFELNNIFYKIVVIILRIVFGLCGNIWVENKLFAHGFQIRSVECSRTSEKAIECFQNTVREFSTNS